MIGIHHEYTKEGNGASKSSSYKYKEDRELTESQRGDVTLGLPTSADQLKFESSPSRAPRAKLESTSSSSSADWCTVMDDDNRRLEVIRREQQRYRESMTSWLMKKGYTKEEAVAEIETDEVILVRRQKQVEYGKNNKSYNKYNKTLPRRRRLRGVHPSTPDKFQVCSRRSWEQQVRIWKRNIHEYSSTGHVHGNRRATKRMLSADICSDTSSENDHPIDRAGSSLNNSLSSVCLTESHSGSRPSSPLTPMTPLTPLSPPNSYAAIAARRPSADIVPNPKTPTATPAEGDPTTSPEMSPAPIDHSELIRALRKVEVSPPGPAKRNRKNLAQEFTRMPLKESTNKGM